MKNHPEKAKLIQWQKQLLPFMSRMTIALAVFFFVASFGQLVYLHWSISAPSRAQSDRIDELLTETEILVDKEAVFATKAVLTLEAEALQRRYHQANVLLMSRVWTRYLGFVTGMTLALLGAVFILGKLESSESEASAELQGAKYALRSASPGVMLVGFGTLLMITTIVVHHDIAVTDQPVYANSLSSQGPIEDSKPALSRPSSDLEDDIDSKVDLQE